MPLWKNGARLIGALLVAAILGALLASGADMVAPELVAGTPLGAESHRSPVIWTGIGAVAIYAYTEVSG